MEKHTAVPEHTNFPDGSNISAVGELCESALSTIQMKICCHITVRQ